MFDEQIQQAAQRANLIVQGGLDLSAGVERLISQQLMELNSQQDKVFSHLSTVVANIEESADKPRENASDHVRNNSEEALNRLMQYENHVKAQAKQLISLVSVINLKMRFDMKPIEQVLMDVQHKNKSITDEIRNMTSNVKSLHKEIHRFDRNTYRFYDIWPVNVLFAFAVIWVGCHFYSTEVSRRFIGQPIAGPAMHMSVAAPAATRAATPSTKVRETPPTLTSTPTPVPRTHP